MSDTRQFASSQPRSEPQQPPPSGEGHKLKEGPLDKLKRKMSQWSASAKQRAEELKMKMKKLVKGDGAL